MYNVKAFNFQRSESFAYALEYLHARPIRVLHSEPGYDDALDHISLSISLSMLLWLRCTVAAKSSRMIEGSGGRPSASLYACR